MKTILQNVKKKFFLGKYLKFVQFLSYITLIIAHFWHSICKHQMSMFDVTFLVLIWKTWSRPLCKKWMPQIKLKCELNWVILPAEIIVDLDFELYTLMENRMGFPNGKITIFKEIMNWLRSIIFSLTFMLKMLIFPHFINL